MIGLVRSLAVRTKESVSTPNPVMECLLMVWLIWCQCLIGVFDQEAGICHYFNYIF